VKDSSKVADFVFHRVQEMVKEAIGILLLVYVSEFVMGYSANRVMQACDSKEFVPVSGDSGRVTFSVIE
jgi:hypothetical protein